jgi:hypothetical protein
MTLTPGARWLDSNPRPWDDELSVLSLGDHCYIFNRDGLLVKTVTAAVHALVL